MAPHIPAELKYMIMENLHGDKKTLAACSILAQGWQCPARTVLFRSITLRAGCIPTKPHPSTPQTQVPDYEAFVTTLPPTLLNAVHDLGMSGSRLSPRRDFVVFDRHRGDAHLPTVWPEDNQPSEHGPKWATLQLDVILRIVAALPNLKALSLSDFMFQPPAVYDGSLVRLKKITLHSFETNGLDDILRFFDAFGASKLVLGDISPTFMIAGEDSQGPVYAPPGVALVKSLEFMGTTASVRVLGAMQMNPPPLTSLAVHIQTLRELRKINSLLKFVTSSLKRLFLDARPAFIIRNSHVLLYQDVFDALLALDLGPLENLTHFEVSFRLGSYASDTRMMIRLIVAMLLSLPPLLSHLTLHFDFTSYLFEAVLTLPWSMLELGLCNRDGLRRVEFVITQILDGRKTTILEEHRRRIYSVISVEFVSIEDIFHISF